MDENIKCYCCSAEVKPIPFGYGYVWICPKCERVIRSESVKVEGNEIPASSQQYLTKEENNDSSNSSTPGSKCDSEG